MRWQIAVIALSEAVCNFSVYPHLASSVYVQTPTTTVLRGILSHWEECASLVCFKLAGVHGCLLPRVERR